MGGPDVQSGSTQKEEFDPMVVVFGASKKQGSFFRIMIRHRKYLILGAASILCVAMILWNHASAPASLSQMTKELHEVTLEHSGREGQSPQQREAEESLNDKEGIIGVQFRAADKTDQLPSKFMPAIPLHAAEALQCRDSVVGFVINATDVKDECEGLKKAFDKTCGDQPESVAQMEKQVAEHTEKVASEILAKKRRNKQGALRKPGFQKKRKRSRARNNQVLHRRLSRKIFDDDDVPYLKKLKAWLFNTRRTTLTWWKYFTGESQDFLFAENEILKAWDDAESLVINDLDGIVNAELRRKFDKERHRRYRREQRRLTEENLGGDSRWMNTTIENRGNSSQMAINRTSSKPVNLDLPTLNKHASESMLEDVLILSRGDQLINQTNAAVQEAAVSSKAISNTAAAVSKFLNDPTSVEARVCCASILNVYHENCSSDNEEEISDRRLFLIVLVMALCGVVKSLIRYYRVVWLPEAAGCILVGVASGYVLMFFPHNDISFDGHWFLRIMVPPIIFEAALSIDKKSFNRHVVPILLYAVIGTLLATFITAEILHRGSTMMSRWCTPIPYIESLTFGALISSIDPIAVLSVLSNMGMTDKDTIYVLIFGESLLNDGVAIVLFETLVHFLDEQMLVDDHAIAQATFHFLAVALGSLMVGALAGYAGTVFFWLFQGCQTPLVEVLLFFCWALLPYYVCDGIGWSGIVSAVATGFIMDVHIVGQRHASISMFSDDFSAHTPQKSLSFGSRRDIAQSIFANPDGHLSGTARTHIGFVAGLIATTMETAIFAYLGLFLFSHRYHWNFFHSVVAILACCVSRGVMIPSLSLFANMLTRLQDICGKRQNNTSATTGVIIGHKMQFILWFAGLRGAMSFALVESIPLYDSYSGQGTPFKAELKAMTSGCIMFTVFVLGGYTYFVMDSMGMAPGRTDDTQLSPGEIGDESTEPFVQAASNNNQKGRRRLRPAD